MVILFSESMLVQFMTIAMQFKTTDRLVRERGLEPVNLSKFVGPVMFGEHISPRTYLCLAHSTYSTIYMRVSLGFKGNDGERLQQFVPEREKAAVVRFREREAVDMKQACLRLVSYVFREQFFKD